MSLIPSISIGRKTSRSKFHIPSMTHGTSEIGYVYPSYSRNLINNSHFSISSRQAIRLSPLFVPTMGDLSLRTYHAFIPHNKVWTPFDAFLDKKPFAFPDGTSKVPLTIPHFIVGELLRYFMSDYMLRDTFFDDLDSLRSNLVMSVYQNDPTLGGVPKLMSLSDINRLFSPSDVNVICHGKQIVGKSYDRLNTFFRSNYFTQATAPLSECAIPSILYAPSDVNTSNPWNGSFFTFAYGQDGNGFPVYPCVDLFNYTLYNDGNDVPDTVLFNRVKEHVNGLAIPSYDACDFMLKVDVPDGPTVITYYFCYNFNGAWKRLRSIFLGLGYCFNPFDKQNVTPLKLLAFYRAYWNLFGVNRNINFQDTNCAKFTRLISAMSGGSISFGFGASSVYVDFFTDLTHCTYTCPPDYFSACVDNTQQGILDSQGVSISSPVGSLAATDTIQGVASPSDDTQPGAKNPTFGDNEISGLAVQMALKMLRFVNRYTVVGSKIYDSLNARYGKIDINDESSEGVKVIGQDSTSINIGAIFNQSDTNDGAPLGDFAGVGTGNGKSDRYSFDVSAFGTFVSLTVVVPQMGYFQGMLRENSDGVGDSYEMFDDTYDAVGWQLVRNNELVADRQFECSDHVGTNLGNFGFIPRYSHMKVGFNRCLGDISLPHLQNSMLPYTLDRFFNQRDTLPVNNPQWFRSGTRGDTNRIFQSVSPTDDHVIWQIYFDVEYDAPMKSISESFDTRLPDDNSTVDVSHV